MTNNGFLSQRLLSVRVGAVMLVCLYTGDTRTRQIGITHSQGDREDCPHYWKEIAVAPVISDIPEFHDCQRLTSHDGRSYGTGPVAIFAHEQLSQQFERVVGRWAAKNRRAAWQIASGTVEGPRITFDPARSNDQLRQIQRDLARTHRDSDAVVFAEIVNYGGEYPPLGIKPGFNCLFLTVTKELQLTAAMVNVDTDKLCLRPARFDTLIKNGAKRLNVRPTAIGRDSADYPPVARWDWDGNTHYIGLMCGPAWCEIGDGTLASSENYTGDRTRVVKGWYDEQRLAITGANGALEPSQIVGTIFPTPELKKLQADGSLEPFHKKWVHVASVGLSLASEEYRDKLNLELSPAQAARNLISLCYGAAKADCAPRISLLGSQSVTATATWKLPNCEPHENTTEVWWAKIQAAESHRVEYRCVQRWPAPSVDAQGKTFTVPATARWRWLKIDETMWEGCIQGCCETQRDS